MIGECAPVPHQGATATAGERLGALRGDPVLGIAQTGLGRLETQRLFAVVVHDALFHDGHAHRADPQHGEHDEQQQADQ